jgi:general secretion pathway protein L
MFRDFFAWWIGQLSDLLPERWRRPGPGREDALIIEPSPEADAIAVSLRRRGRETTLGRFNLAADAARLPAPNGQRCVLRLPQTGVLAKTVSLPIAAERHVHQALQFQMDQETPFTSGEIYWSHYITGRDRQSGRLAVRLLLVPRANLAALLRAIGRVGIVPTRLVIADGPDRDHALPLDGDDAAANGVGRRALLWPVAACLALLALGAIGAPFVRQAAALSGLEDDIATSRTAATEVGKLRGELDRLSGALDLVESERDKAGRPLALLATLTRLLPDDTYLNELAEQQRRVTLSGRSAGAARLIAALSTGEGLRNVVFAAPVTRLDALRTELFTITAEAAP